MTNKLRLGRRDALAMVTGAAIAATAGAPAEAADIALSCWTGYPELVPWYKERGDAYAKDHPGFSLNLLSTTLREHEQKLAAAVPTGTGPDLFDIGLNISVNFIEAGLIKPNPPAIDKQSQERRWYARSSSTTSRSTARPTACRSCSASPAMLLQQGDVHARLAWPGAGDLPGADGRREEAGEVRQHGQDDAERHQPPPFRPGQRHRREVPLHPRACRRLADSQTQSGKWHQNFDNDAGRARSKFYIDAVQKSIASTTPRSSTTPTPSSPAPQRCCSARRG